MSWQQLSGSRYSRPLDILEKFFIGIGTTNPASGKEPFSINVLVKVELDPSLGKPIEVLRKAWKQIRLRFPEIVSTHDGTNKYYDLLADQAALESWALETCFLEKPNVSPQDVMRGFRAGEQMTLRLFPGTGELLLHTPHWLIDGLACIYLLDHFFAAIASQSTQADVKVSQEHVNLQPSVEIAAGLKDSKEIDKQAMDLFMTMAKDMPSVGFAPDAGSGTKTATAFATLRFSPDTTSALIAACKAHGIGITAAMHAALIHVVGKQDSTKKYVSVLRVNMRPYLPEPFNSASYPLNPCVSGTPAALVPQQSFIELANQMQAIYTDRTRMGNVLRYLKGWVSTLLNNPPPPDAPTPANPDFNSLGVVDRLLRREHGEGKVRILEFWHGSEQVNTNQEVYMWTWRDELNLLVCFNEALYNPATIQTYLEQSKQVLLEGLNVAGE